MFLCVNDCKRMCTNKDQPCHNAILMLVGISWWLVPAIHGEVDGFNIVGDFYKFGIALSYFYKLNFGLFLYSCRYVFVQY